MNFYRCNNQIISMFSTKTTEIINFDYDIMKLKNVCSKKEESET